MPHSLERLFQKNSRACITALELENLFNGSPDSRYGKVKRLLAQGKLLHIRRGLYCIADKMRMATQLHPFELAQYIYPPSYISFESALAYHHLIPEAVYVITSASIKRSKDFHTPLGLFSYVHLPAKNFYSGVTLVAENDMRFFVATPWKALCDYVFHYKKEWNSFEPLVKSLRINKEDLPVLRDEEIELLEDYYHHTRISGFLKGLKQELTK